MPNYLNTLMNGLMADDSVQSISRQTGVGQSQVQEVIQAALPVLLQSMVNNTSDPEGAQSLDKALNDHAQRGGGLVEQMKTVDTEDGNKIVGHLLGGNKPAVEGHLAESSGLQSNQVGAIMASLAPVLLSAVGKQKQAANVDDGSGLGGILTSILTGSAAGSGISSGNGLGGILDMFLGGDGGQATPGMSSAKSGNTDLLSSIAKLLSGK